MSGLSVVKTYMPAVLRRYRREAGLSQQKLADGAGMVKSYIAALELGYRAPNLNVLCNISKVLGVNPSEIVSDFVEAMEKGEAAKDDAAKGEAEKAGTGGEAKA